jgi:hypothetical protein
MLFSCKKETASKEIIKPLTIAEKIAQANGLDQWENVNEIQFTFNVDRTDSHFERSWKWNPKTNDVTMISGNDSITFNHKQVDSTSMNADKGFINDKYWLLAPFNMVWDEGTTIQTKDSVPAPLSGKIMNQLTLEYGAEGGYTPGDAYDFYYDNDLLISEWVFRKSNQEDPSMITTWEDYEDFNGIKISKTRIGKDNSVKLYFTGIKVE